MDSEQSVRTTDCARRTNQVVSEGGRRYASTEDGVLEVTTTTSRMKL